MSTLPTPTFASIEWSSTVPTRGRSPPFWMRFTGFEMSHAADD